MAILQHVLEQQASLEEGPGLERLLLRLQQRWHALHGSVGQAIERFTASQLAEEMEQTLMHLVYVSQASGAEIPGPYVYRKIRKAVRARLKAFQIYAPYVQPPECNKARRSRLTKRRYHGDMIRRLWQLTQLAF